MSSTQRKIAGALILGAALIAGALFLRTPSSENTPSQQNIAVVATAPERKPIKTLDENNDGVPDWQEALVGTNAVELSDDVSDYKAPETLTEQFALDFFQDIVRAENYGAFGDSPEELVQRTSNSLAEQAQDILLTKRDIVVSNDNSLSAFIQYGESIARIATKYEDTSEESEITILENALRNQDTDSLVALDSKITYHKNVLRDTKVLPVPSLFTQQHLNLLNSYQAILNDIISMRSAFDDPMLALLRIKRYQDDAVGLNQSIINVYTSLLDSGASWDNTSIVFSLIAIDDEI